MASKTETHLFFPTVLREVIVDNHQALTAQIMAGIDKIKKTQPNSLPSTWSCDLFTTIGAPTAMTEQEEFKPLLDVIMREANGFAKILEMDTDKHPLKCNECWLNVYTEGHAQDVHLHGNSVISGIYYPKAPPGSGALLIHSPFNDVMLDPPTRELNELNIKVMAIKPRPGLMVLFRSFVKHSVMPTRGTDERISIAFNLTM